METVFRKTYTFGDSDFKSSGNIILTDKMEIRIHPIAQVEPAPSLSVIGKNANGIEERGTIVLEDGYYSGQFPFDHEFISLKMEGIKKDCTYEVTIYIPEPADSLGF